MACGCKWTWRILGAADPTSFADALSDSLAKIAERTSSASAVATNSSKMSTNTQLFQGRFNSAGGLDKLQAFPIDASGAIQAAQWDASAKIPPFQSGKHLLTKLVLEELISYGVILILRSNKINTFLFFKS